MAVVKGDRIGESNGLNKASIEAQDFYARLVATCPDDFGRFRAVPLLMAGKLYPRREPTVALFNRIKKMLNELRACGQWQHWTTDGILFGEITKYRPSGNRFHATPEPPWSEHVHNGVCIKTAVRCASAFGCQTDFTILTLALNDLRERRHVEKRAPSAPSAPSSITDKQTMSSGDDLDLARAAVEYWKLRAQVSPRSGEVLAKYRARAQKRLAEGLTLDQLKAAVDGALGDDFWRAKGKDPVSLWRDHGRVLELEGLHAHPRGQAKQKTFMTVPGEPVTELASPEDTAKVRIMQEEFRAREAARKKAG